MPRSIRPGFTLQCFLPFTGPGEITSNDEHDSTCYRLDCGHHGDTIFEIGSITKVFTSLLLAPQVKVPERSGRTITLQDLSTHTSALPRLPTNFSPKDPSNPYADYSVDQLYQFLASVQLTRDIGSQYEYSNVGGGLLGHVLSRRAGMDYEALVRSRITGPLGMTSTRQRSAGDENRSRH